MKEVDEPSHIGLARSPLVLAVNKHQMRYDSCPGSLLELAKFPTIRPSRPRAQLLLMNSYHPHLSPLPSVAASGGEQHFLRAGLSLANFASGKAWKGGRAVKGTTRKPCG